MKFGLRCAGCFLRNEFQKARRGFASSIGATPSDICLRDATDFQRDFGSGLGLDQRRAEIDRTDCRLVITGHKPDHRFAEKFLDLPQIQIDLFAPAIHDDANFLTRVAEAIEDLERSLRAANRRNIERQDQNDFV